MDSRVRTHADRLSKGLISTLWAHGHDHDLAALCFNKLQGLLNRVLIKLIEYAVGTLTILSGRIDSEFLLRPRIGDLFNTDSDLHGCNSFARILLTIN